MRIADKMNFDQVTSNLGRNRTELADLQNQAATQKRVNRPSDDPLAAARVLASRTEINGGQQFIKNINSAKSFLEYSEQSLGELTEVLVRAKELAVAQANDASSNPKSRSIVATEVDQLHDQSIHIANRKLGERFLFGGFKTTKAPFDKEGYYRGDDGEMQISVGKEAKIAMNMPGSRIFLGKDLRRAHVQAEQTERVLNGEPPYEIKDSTGVSAPQPTMRGPASEGTSDAPSNSAPSTETSNLPPEDADYSGANVFDVLKNFTIALRSNDKAGVQDAMDSIDSALDQIVLARSEMGARVSALNSAMESLQKSQVDAKTLASSLEDADTFELVSDLNKSETTLKATLETSGKLIQPTLLDFLK